MRRGIAVRVCTCVSEGTRERQFVRVRQYQMAVSSQDFDNCIAVYSNHLLIVLELQGITGRSPVNPVTYTARSGSTPHFINKTIFLHRPFGLLYDFAARMGDTMETIRNLFFTMLTFMHFCSASRLRTKLISCNYWQFKKVLFKFKAKQRFEIGAKLFVVILTQMSQMLTKCDSREYWSWT